MIDFAEGGRLLMDFTEVGPSAVDVGTEMRMVFRIKDNDPVRGFARYFWKAAPIEVGGLGHGNRDSRSGGHSGHGVLEVR